jgi:hypothetical protein
VVGEFKVFWSGCDEILAIQPGKFEDEKLEENFMNHSRLPMNAKMSRPTNHDEFSVSFFN